MNFYGDQTRWFVARVVDWEDDYKGRVKIRVLGLHSESINDEDLPWAKCVLPTTEGGTSGIGKIPQVLNGAFVFGMFLDGKDSQLPLIFGSLPKYEGKEKSVNKLARGENTLTKSVSVSGAPGDPYGAVYPNNKVTQTTSGHVIEIDDTPNAERIHIRHKSGTFVEFHPDGSVVIKTANVYIDAGANANLRADAINVIGGTGDVVVDGVSLVNHTHSHTDTAGLGAGTRNTRPPNKG